MGAVYDNTITIVIKWKYDMGSIKTYEWDNIGNEKDGYFDINEVDVHLLWHQFTNNIKMLHISMAQNSGCNDIILSWLIIDSGSTCTMNLNQNILAGIHKLNRGICIT